MRNFLLSVLATLFVSVASMNAMSKIDTVYYKPGDVCNVELQLNLEAYPYLEFEDVTWVAGFEPTFADFSPNGNHTVIGKLISEENIITASDGKKYLHIEKLGENWFGNSVIGMEGIRTITVYNSHKVIPTKSVDHNSNVYFEDGDLDGSICDTIAVLHILKQIGKKDFNFTFDGNQTTYYAADTVVARPRLVNDELSELDVFSYGLIAVDGTDTTLLATSDTDSLSFIAEETEGMKIHATITNDLGTTVSNVARTIVVLPQFEVTSLQYTTSNADETKTITVEGVEETEVKVLNHDSLSLVVNTNAKESQYSLTYAWNKDGEGLPTEGVVANKNVLTFSEFVKPDMDGTYNCIITDKETGKAISTVSFIVTSEYPTANETISVKKGLTYVNGTLYADEPMTGVVRVYSMIGGLVKAIQVSDATEVSIDVPQGIYLIEVGGETLKISNK